MVSAAEAAAIVELINRRHGTSLRNPKRAPGGESLPWIVIDLAGKQYLLKCSDGAEFRIEQAMAVTDRLRSRGYPIPPYLAAGRDGRVGYAVRAMVPGRPIAAPMQPLDPRWVPQLLELNDLQRDAAAGIECNWRDRIFDSILVGFTDWCRLDRFRAYSDETARVLVQLQEFAVAMKTMDLRAVDAVHGDFNGANILIDDSQVTAVIDWESSDAGDRAFDLATLLFCDYLNPPVHDMLLERIREIAAPEVIKLYLAHMIIRQVEWSISHHTAAVVEHFLRITRAIVRDL